MEIVIHAGDPISERRNESAPLVIQSRACVIGPTTKPLHLKPARNVDVIGIRLHPWAAGALFGANAADFRDQTVGLGDLAKLNTDIVDRVGSAATLADRLGGITDMLLTFRRQTVDERVEHALKGVTRADATVRVESLAGALAVTERTLERWCSRHVGMSPKEMFRVSRIQRALAIARANPRFSWSRIALDAGFYDQPHFVREFEDLVGESPSKYRARNDALTEVLAQPGDPA